MPSIANPPPSPKRTTLEDAFNARLVAQHPKKLGLTNAERSNEDQKITSALCATWRLPKQATSTGL